MILKLKSRAGSMRGIMLNRLDSSLVTTDVPIEEWLRLVHEADDKSAQEGLRQIYRNNYPTQAEFIFTAGCELECAHCIYPPDYVKYNASISTKEWVEIAEQLLNELKIQTFVYGGRSLTRGGVEFLKTLREKAPHAHIGLIDNGMSINRFREELAEIKLDWIDISLDGIEHDHDIQRAKKGSFRQALESALWLKEQRIAPKVNILTCLTTINRNSVIPMIREVNQLGFKNFFITPVTVYDGYRPKRSLVVSNAEFAHFIQELEAAVPELNDSWVELNIFDVEYMEYIGTEYRELWESFAPQHDCLERVMSSGDNDFRVHYYPSSLSGVTEFIINSNGNVILPKVMAKNKMTENDIKGSLLEMKSYDIVQNFPGSEQFNFHGLEMINEKRIFKAILEKYDANVK